MEMSSRDEHAVDASTSVSGVDVCNSGGSDVSLSTVCEGVSCVCRVGVSCVSTFSWICAEDVHLFSLSSDLWVAFSICFLNHADVAKLSRWVHVTHSSIQCLSLKETLHVDKWSLSFARSLDALTLVKFCFFLIFTILIQFGQVNLECLVSSSQEMSLSNSRAMSVANFVVIDGRFLFFLCFFCLGLLSTAATYVIKICYMEFMGHYNLLEMIRYKPLEMIWIDSSSQ